MMIIVIIGENIANYGFFMVLLMMSRRTLSTWTLPSLSGDDDDNDDNVDDAKHLDPPSPLRWHRRAFRELALLQIIHQSHNDFFDNDNLDNDS